MNSRAKWKVHGYPGLVMKVRRDGNEILGYPSKQIGFFIWKSLIFRSDSNDEDLEGYAGAGLYDSVATDKEEEIMLDYSFVRVLIDKGFQRSIFSKIAEAGEKY
ncbi:hypothetical protein BVC80_5g44 [Macleaya cordata]|uniref:Uncharacterized protein n=1 Tax=Macleaya cordata TaxID=56857 RepID=A0A200QXQ0_MACCD|nr:hypothetical protein BVC80_5g44 [Macleaya cordata]